jgi:hypothetical protein
MPLNYKEEQRAVEAFNECNVNLFVNIILQRVLKDKNIKSLQDCIIILTKMSTDQYNSEFANRKHFQFTDYRVREAIDRSYEWFCNRIPDLEE